MKYICVLLFAVSLAAQTPVGTTLVTATIIDSHTMPYAGGTFSAKLAPPSGTLLNPITGSLNDSGEFRVSLKPGTWDFHICAHDTITCFDSTQDVSGDSVDFTTELSAASVPYYTHQIGAAKIGQGGITFADGTNQSSTAGDLSTPHFFTGDVRFYGPVQMGQVGGATATLTWNGSTSGVNVWTMASTGGTVTATAPIAATKFRNLPTTFALTAACSAGFEGSTAAITDSSTATWGATITGGGSNHVLGYCNGSNWTVAAK